MVLSETIGYVVFRSNEPDVIYFFRVIAFASGIDVQHETHPTGTRSARYDVEQLFAVRLQVERDWSEQ